jgi:hypothetical protein
MFFVKSEFVRVPVGTGVGEDLTGSKEMLMALLTIFVMIKFR